MAKKVVVFIGTAVIFAAMACALILPMTLGDHKTDESVRQTFKGSSVLIGDTPLIDGHNDLPYQLYRAINNQLGKINLDSNLLASNDFGSLSTDLPRMREGQVGAQFWVAYVDCSTRYKDAVERTMAQIDVIKRMIKAYPKHLQLATSADEIMDAYNNNKIASLIAVEGGHSIDDRLSVLRLYHEMGVRYMTLTHSCNLAWADASPIDADEAADKLHLSEWGENVIAEMNRLGIMVDLSHVSHGVMLRVLDVAKAPVIFSHSNSYTVFAHHRNVRDDVLLRVRDNNGVVMVNFHGSFLTNESPTVYHVMRHINYIRDLIGVDHVGIGSDYDGGIRVPQGLEDTSKFPELFDLLANPDENYDTFTPWTAEELRKLAGKNLLRVFRAVEEKSKELADEVPVDEIIPDKDIWALDSDQKCKSDFNYVPTEGAEEEFVVKSLVVDDAC